MVLDRRAGQGPTPFPVDRTDDLGRLRAGVLDPLRFVENDGIEINFRIGDHLRVTGQCFVVDDFQGTIADLPSRASPFGILREDFKRQVGCPHFQLAAPIVDQRLRTDHQHRAEQPLMELQSQRQDRLHRFAKAHFVGKQCRVTRHQKGNPFQLVIERLERHFQRSIEQSIERSVAANKVVDP